MHIIPEVTALVNDLDPAFRDARKPGYVFLARPAVDALALDEDGGPSDILADRSVSATSRVQDAAAFVADIPPGLVTHLASRRTNVRLLSLSTLPSHIHNCSVLI